MKSFSFQFHCETMARQGAASEQILRDVAEVDSEFLLEKEIILESLTHLDPLQADNWPLIMQAALDIGVSKSTLEKMYLTELMVQELLQGDIVPPEDKALNFHDKLITASHYHMRQLSDNIKNMQLGVSPG